MNVLLSWLLAILIIIIVGFITMGIAMSLYWIWQIKLVLKRTPTILFEEIKKEKENEKEVSNDREDFRREKQRRIGTVQTQGLSREQRPFVQSESPSKLPEVRESVSRSESRDGEVKERDKSDSSRHGRVTGI